MRRKEGKRGKVLMGSGYEEEEEEERKRKRSEKKALRLFFPQRTSKTAASDTRLSATALKRSRRAAATAST